MAVETAQPRAGPRDHVVQFYEREDQLVATVSRYVVDALRAGEVAVVVATDAHRDAFEASMVAGGIDVAVERESRSYITLDAGEALSQFLIGGQPDAEAFDTVIGGLLRQAAGTGCPVRAYGEMVALLWEAGQVTEAIEVESLWNELGQDLPFSLFCAYPLESVAREDRAEAFHEVCHLHSAVVGVPSAPAPPVEPGPGRAEEARSFVSTPDAPKAARRFVVGTLARWDQDQLSDQAALVVSELATNAVIHARSDFIVSVSSLRQAVRISVRDTSVTPPTQRDSAPMALSGRGLGLVAALASRWGVDLLAGGKVVWAELAR